MKLASSASEFVALFSCAFYTHVLCSLVYCGSTHILFANYQNACAFGDHGLSVHRSSRSMVCICVYVHICHANKFASGL